MSPCPKGCGGKVEYVRKTNGRFVAVDPESIEGFTWDGRLIQVQAKHRCPKIAPAGEGNTEGP
jgi:hypothetical protein